MGLALQFAHFPYFIACAVRHQVKLSNEAHVFGRDFFLNERCDGIGIDFQLAGICTADDCAEFNGQFSSFQSLGRLPNRPSSQQGPQEESSG